MQYHALFYSQRTADSHKMPSDLESVLQKIVKVVNMVTSRPLSVPYQRAVRRNGQRVQDLLFHTEAHWLPSEKMLTGTLNEGREKYISSRY
jgi:hypothetical protein